MKKGLIYFITALLIVLPMLALFMTDMASADTNEMLWNNTASNFQSTTGLGDRDPREIAAQIINVMLGFIGVIAMVIILLGGFKWMVSGGNEDRISDAKKLIGSGVIGLIIVLASFAIAQFVLNAVYSATGANG